MSFNVDMTLALSSPSYAARAWRSGELTAAQRGQIVAHYGSAVVTAWESVDSTQYNIITGGGDGSLYEQAVGTGRDNAANQAGYDGSKGYGALGDAAMGAAGVGAAGVSVAATGFTKIAASNAAKTAAEQAAKEAGKNAMTKFSESVAGKATEEAANKALTESVEKTAAAQSSKEAAKKASLGAWIAAALAIATVAKYLIEKPNKEQYEAIMKLLEKGGASGILVNGNNDLTTAQTDMQTATDEQQDLVEDSEEKTEAAEDELKEDSALMQEAKRRYDAIINRANEAGNGGPPLTESEKYDLTILAPILFDMIANDPNIQKAIQDGLAGELGDNADAIAEFESRYMDGAEKLGEVQGMADYAEGFDQMTQTMCYVEAGAQGLNALSGGIAAAKLCSTALFNVAQWAMGVAAGVAAGLSLKFVYDQITMASDIGEEIDYRESTLNPNIDTTYDVYEEELDNFAANFEFVSDGLELDVPDTPDAPAPLPTGGGGDDPPPTDPTGGDNPADPLGGNGGDDDDKGKDPKVE